MKQARSPYGYKKLLVYTKAEELQKNCALLTSHFLPAQSGPHSKTLYSLKDQMDRSARSVKQNIVEGWKRNSTKEYYEFLGFSLGANAELEEDCNDIINGVYKDLKGITGVMGERRKEGEMGEMGLGLEEVEKLPFYPLNTRLSPVVQLKLRCKELNLLLEKLQRALLEKMSREGGLPHSYRVRQARTSTQESERWLEQYLDERGFRRLKNGRVVPKGKKG